MQKLIIFFSKVTFFYFLKHRIKKLILAIFATFNVQPKDLSLESPSQAEGKCPPFSQAASLAARINPCLLFAFAVPLLVKASAPVYYAEHGFLSII